MVIAIGLMISICEVCSISNIYADTKKTEKMNKEVVEQCVETQDDACEALVEEDKQKVAAAKKAEADKKAAEEQAAAEAEASKAKGVVTYSSYSGQKLTASAGAINGPSGKETYYNLDMSGVVNIMRSQGFDASSYPYWVREDGVKMLGDYVMVAAELSIRPRGSTIATSLGTGLVCDTGTFTETNPMQLDIATAW